VTVTWQILMQRLGFAPAASPGRRVDPLDLDRLSPHAAADLNLPLDILARHEAELARRRIWR
jgi:hypothetical protein